MLDKTQYELILYIAGISTDNQTAILEIKKYMKEKTNDHYALDVIDILERPEMAADDGVLATPTVVKKRPDPIVKVILDFTTKARLLMGLELLFQNKKLADE